MKKNRKIKVLDTQVTVSRMAKEDYISLTDIARHLEPNRTDHVIQNWMRNRNTVEFLGIWERLNNPDFNPLEFEGIRNQAGLNSFVLTPKRWIETTGAIGIQSRAGRYGGTFAHRDIAFEFASWVSAEFKLYLIKEFQRLQAAEQKHIVRDIDELMILNDEAHHIHDASLAWLKSIEEIHNRLLQKGSSLSLQIDVTATPKHNNGAIFVQTICDYPLVEAIFQNVVKHPVLPDAASREKLQERQSVRCTEKYADYFDLGGIEWRKTFVEHAKLGKKAILFVMTDDTKNCDEVAEYLENRYPELKDAVLVIHTKNNGEISEASSGKKKEELEKLRRQSNEINSMKNPYKAIASVLMLKEGWDVRNVTTIVGLRAYSAKSNILPEQTLGRGLRKMYSPGRGSGLGKHRKRHGTVGNYTTCPHSTLSIHTIKEISQIVVGF